MLFLPLEAACKFFFKKLHEIFPTPEPPFLGLFVKELLEPVEEDEVVLKLEAHQPINIHPLLDVQFCEGVADYFEIVQAVRFLFWVKLHSGDWNLPWEEDVEKLTISSTCSKLLDSSDMRAEIQVHPLYKLLPR